MLKIQKSERVTGNLITFDVIRNGEHAGTATYLRLVYPDRVVWSQLKYGEGEFRGIDAKIQVQLDELWRESLIAALNLPVPVSIKGRVRNGKPLKGKTS